MKHNIVSHADCSFQVLIVLSFTDAIRQLPAHALFSIRFSYWLLVRLVYIFVPAHINEYLLVEEGLFDITHHSFRHSLNTKASFRLNKVCSSRHFILFFHFQKVSVLFISELWIWDFINILTHDILKFRFSHGFSKSREFLMWHIHLFSFNKRMIDFFSIFKHFLTLVDFNAVKIFGRVGVDHRSF